MKINLFINWFQSKTRPNEFEYCLLKNLLIFDRVINLNGRPTFNEFFATMSKYPDDCNVIANLDIFFDKSIYLAKNIKKGVAYCITRHEWTGQKAVSFADYNYGHPGEWSQDAWVFTGNKILDIDAPFPLGYRGCDNYLATGAFDFFPHALAGGD